LRSLIAGFVESLTQDENARPGISKT